MNEREAWLGLTQEEAIEPDLPICDPHHHVWDYPGSRYLLDELTRDINGDTTEDRSGELAARPGARPSGGHRVVKTVFVECRQFYHEQGPEALRPVGETEFVDQLAGPALTTSGQTEIAAGIVGFADLAMGAAVQDVLEAHLEASKRFRGVRHASAWDESDRIHNAHTNPPPGLLADGLFREGLACVEKMGLSFDAWLYHPQIHELTGLARDMPGLNIVLDHMAGPLGIGPYSGRREEVREAWVKSMVELAKCENVSVKLGGLTMSMSGFGWHKMPVPPGSIELAQAMGPYYLACIELFGADRCMFESNFPVDRASCSYTVLWNAFKHLSRACSDAERSALFYDTANRVYRLDGH